MAELDHIVNRRLYQVVVEDAVLNEAEINHLNNCDECLQMIRVLIHQTASRQ